MVKTFTIDGRAISFKSTMALTYRYQAQFGKDVLKVIWPAVSFLFKDGASLDDINALGEVQLTDIQDVIWVLAKTADNDLPEPFEFWDSIEEFPAEYISELFRMIISTMQNTEKFKKKLKAEKSK